MYVKVNTSGDAEQYPYTLGMLRSDNPNISFPREMSESILSSYGVYSVSILDKPSYDKRTQKIEQNASPSFNGEAWELSYNVIDKSSSEISEYDTSFGNAVRTKRDSLLAETDYLGLSDHTMSAQMAAYRQALRDITAHANWPYLNDDNWPTKPE
jgi:hypothetical protein